MKIRTIMGKYKDMIPYAVFGILTTMFNIATYWCMAHLIGLNWFISTIIAWVVAVAFAYLTNRKWVFHSKVKSTKGIVKEIVMFFGCRFLTEILDLLCMYVFVDFLQLNDILIKFIANIMVIIANYVASKMVIFKKKEG